MIPLSPVDPLRLAERLRVIAQAGLTYSEGPFDRDRYEKLLSIAAEVAAGGLGLPVDGVAEILRAERGYPTPKVDVRAVVPQGDQVLFVREVTDGLWALPGGWADAGVSPADMAAREVLEETGYVVKPVRLLAILDKARHGHPPDPWATYKLFFLCRLEGGAPRPSFETPECAFFQEGALPPLSTPRNTERQIRRMFEHLRTPGLPTDFD